MPKWIHECNTVLSLLLIYSTYIIPALSLFKGAQWLDIKPSGMLVIFSPKANGQWWPKTDQ